MRISRICEPRACAVNPIMAFFIWTMCPGLTVETEETCNLYTDETKCNNAFTVDRKQCFWGYGVDDMSRSKECHSILQLGLGLILNPTEGGPKSYCRQEQKVSGTPCNTVLCTTDDETKTCTAKDLYLICNQNHINTIEKKSVIKTRPACQSNAQYVDNYQFPDTLGCSLKKSASQCVAGNTQADHRCFWLSAGGNTAMACVELAVRATEESGELIAYNGMLSSHGVADKYCGTPEARAVNHLLCYSSSLDPSPVDYPLGEFLYCNYVAKIWRPLCSDAELRSFDTYNTDTLPTVGCTADTKEDCFGVTKDKPETLCGWFIPKGGDNHVCGRGLRIVGVDIGMILYIAFNGQTWERYGYDLGQVVAEAEKKFCLSLSQTDDDLWLPLWICWVSTAGLYVLAGVVYGGLHAGALWF